ncbi:MAG: LLM class flavin-dependent oxidoreductase [Pseudonocardiaceae bacterium]|nr:LLM class flavin-dependent oxidoreductase [Pseudonocardiaceae bacterium]
MEIGLFHSVQWPEGSSQSDRYRQALRQACHADELGFDSVWLTEHHFSRHGIVSDSLAVLAHLAARTEHVRLGTAVSVLPLHNPLRLAETAATVDQLSGGRLELGVGRGYQVGEFTGFGIDIAEKKERFDEAIEVLYRAWTSDAPFTHEGRYFRYEDAAPQPRPLQVPPPIWVATDSPDGLASCARHDWGVLLPQGTSLDVTATQLHRYHDALSAHGRGVADARVYLARAAHVAPTDDQAWNEAEGPYRSFLSYADKLRRGLKPGAAESGRSPFDMNADLRASALFGSPESVIAGLSKIHDLGIDRVMLFVHMGELPHDKIMDSLTLFAREVLPVVHRL